MFEEQFIFSQAGVSGSGEFFDILLIENIDVDLFFEYVEGQCLFYRRIFYYGVFIYFYYFCNYVVDLMYAKMCIFMWVFVFLFFEYVC